MLRRALLAAAAVAPAVPLLAADKAQAAILPSPLRILCIGDSITLGWGDSSGDGYRRELRRLLNDACVPHQFVVKACAGQTVEQIAQWAPGETSINQPDLVLLLTGTNNANPSTGSLSIFERDYGALLDAIAAAKPGVAICAAWIQHVAVSWDANTQTVSDAITRQVWPTPQGWSAAMRAGVVACANIRSLPVGYLSSDGVHPSMDGYDAMGWAWFAALRPYLGLPT